ncbi:MAG TPA: hypothetical protein VFI96_08040 [Longimicrobiaceae bacterium]|nr:hypothetical protein [Longimicrobiaceae bacterium]
MLFVCAACLSIDNTALAPDYARQLVAARPAGALYTACSEGEWHDEFPRRQYDRAADGPIGVDQTIHPERMEAA